MSRFTLPRRSRVVAGLVTLLLVAGVIVAPSALAIAPTITSFTPTSGKSYSRVVITGSHFASPAAVRFNGVASGAVKVNSSTRITAYVPPTASTGRIKVTTPGGTATSAGTFRVLPGVFLDGTVGPPTSARNAAFSGFGSNEAVDVFFDTAAVALGTADDSGSGTIPFTVPAGATPGTHWVSLVGRHSGYAAQASFLVRSDYPQYGFSANHLGNNFYESTLTTGNVNRLNEAWRTPAHSYAYAAPAVVGGVVYEGFGDGSVAAFDEATGAQKWSHAIGAGIVSSPAVSGGVVYIGADDHYLYALNAATGAVKWRFQTADVVRTSPTVANGTVYVGSFDDKLYALNAATGALRWSYTGTGAIFSSPAFARGAVYFANNSGHVIALDATTGTVRWDFAAAAAVYASPLVVNGRVYVGSTDKNVYALRVSNGSLAWSFTATSGIEATAGYANGTVYVTTDDGKAYALDSATGASHWSVTPSSTALQAAVTVENGIVFVGDYQHIYALVASYGGLVTTLNAGTFYGGPAVVNGAVTVPDYSDGSLVHFTLDNPPVPAARPRTAMLRRQR